ncbi:MAG: ABC transporter substrate-binding protein [Rectinemataceae bacterium]
MASRIHQAKAAATFAFDNLGIRKAAVFVDEGIQEAREMAVEFTDCFSAKGGTAIEASNLLNTGFTYACLEEILEHEPELLYLSCTAEIATKIVIDAKKSGFRGLFLGHDTWDRSDLLRVGGEAVDGLYFTDYWSIGDPGKANQNFIAAYRQKYKHNPNFIAAHAYDSMMLMTDAIRRAGSTDGAKIRDALQAVDMELATGRIRFDKDRNLIKSMVIKTIKAGKAVYHSTVEPA